MAILTTKQAADHITQSPLIRGNVERWHIVRLFETGELPNSFGLSLRDDFGLSGDELVIVKAALTYEQAQQLDLHQGQLAKEDSSRFPRYQELFGDRCWELEAVPTDTLREMVEDTIRSVLDIDAFEREVERESSEQDELDDYRSRVRTLLTEDFQG